MRLWQPASWSWLDPERASSASFDRHWSQRWWWNHCDSKRTSRTQLLPVLFDWRWYWDSFSGAVQEDSSFWNPTIVAGYEDGIDTMSAGKVGRELMDVKCFSGVRKNSFSRIPVLFSFFMFWMEDMQLRRRQYQNLSTITGNRIVYLSVPTVRDASDCNQKRNMSKICSGFRRY